MANSPGCEKCVLSCGLKAPLGLDLSVTEDPATYNLRSPLTSSDGSLIKPERGVVCGELMGYKPIKLVIEQDPKNPNNISTADVTFAGVLAALRKERGLKESDPVRVPVTTIGGVARKIGPFAVPTIGEGNNVATERNVCFLMDPFRLGLTGLRKRYGVEVQGAVPANPVNMGKGSKAA